jgi:arabinosyltransferase B
VLNGRTEGQTVALEYGKAGPEGVTVPRGRLIPYDLGPTPSWRNLRFTRADIPSDATLVRVVVEDRSLTPGELGSPAP